MTPEREQELRQRITQRLCEGCRRYDPFDEQGRHVHSYQQEAFGSTWDSKSWMPCQATPVLVQQWLNFVKQVIEEEKPVRKNRRGIR